MHSRQVRMRKLLASYAAKYRAPLIKSFRKRRFRRLFMEGLESRRLMATIQIEPQGGSTNDAYYSIQLKDVSFVDPIIYTKDDNPEDSDNLQTLYLNSESNIVHFEGFFDQTFKGVRLQLDSQHLYAVESDGTKHPFPLKPMYFTRFDTTNSSSVTFGDFMTFGQPFFVLQEHEQLSNISNPPIVIEGPEFVQATEEDPSLSLESKNKYFKEPQIGDKKVTITGTIDTRNPSDLTQGGDIGLFSRNELKINKGSLLSGSGDITVATWDTGNIFSLKSEPVIPTVTLIDATVRGHDISISAAKILRDFPRQGYGQDKTESKVTIDKSEIIATGKIDVGADAQDIVGVANAQNTMLTGHVWQGVNSLAGKSAKDSLWQYLPKIRNFLNTFSIMVRHATSTVEITDSTLEAEEEVNISSISHVRSLASSVTSRGFLESESFFLAASWSTADSEATLSVQQSAITSKIGDVNIGSSGAAISTAASRALAGYRNAPDQCNKPEFKAANADICPEPQYDEQGHALPDRERENLTEDQLHKRFQYPSNESAVVIALAFSQGNLVSSTTVDSESTISAAGNVKIVALGESEVDPDSTSRSFGDGKVGLAIAIGWDEANVTTKVEGKVFAGGRKEAKTKNLSENLERK